jgi:hypothetical protein
MAGALNTAANRDLGSTLSRAIKPPWPKPQARKNCSRGPKIEISAQHLAREPKLVRAPPMPAPPAVIASPWR